MKLWIIMLVGIFACPSCKGVNAPVPFQGIHTKALSNHALTVVAYEVPKGAFRGAFWPSKDTQTFQLWVIDHGKERLFDLPAPPEFIKYEQDVTKEWGFTASDTSQDRIIYGVERNDHSKSMTIDLPLQKSDYTFAVLKNAQGQELVIFMALSEQAVEKSIFGYVMITSPPESQKDGS